MSKLIIPMAFGCLFLMCSYLSTKVNVIKKETSTRIKPGYYINDDVNTFIYKGDKYLIVTDETFNEAGDVGYSNYTQKDFNKYKNLQNDYSLTKTISVEVIDNQNILVNSKKVPNAEIDKVNKETYYTLGSKDTLYRIKYKSLGFNLPKGTGGSQGIMKYPPRPPIQAAINQPDNESFLPAVIKKSDDKK